MLAASRKNRRGRDRHRLWLLGFAAGVAIVRDRALEGAAEHGWASESRCLFSSPSTTGFGRLVAGIPGAKAFVVMPPPMGPANGIHTEADLEWIPGEAGRQLFDDASRSTA